MTDKIQVNNLVKIFGKHPKSVLKDLKNGASKDEILKETGHTVGVNDVSFSVEDGELFVVMGLSGSGKSTLIRCLNRLHDPTDGDILVDGENVAHFNKNQLKEFRQKKIGMVFQHFGLLNHRTVLENVEYGLEIRNVSKKEREEKAKQALESVGLGGWEDKYPGELSGGMQQRVGLARVLANDPDILLMDEPFSALDPLIRRDMQLELLELQERLKKTIVFITHDINEAFKIGDRVAVMKDGVIEQIDKPENILSDPASNYIKEFISDIDRSKILQADHIMKKPNSIVSLKDGIKVAVKEMEENGLSSVFVVDRQRHLQGIVTIDDAISGIKENKTLQDVIRDDVLTVTKEEYVQDLIPKALETKFPLAVVNDDNRLEGIILRVHVLSGLVANEL